jgi:N-acetylglucosamine kinase-like BadF-type ATPase
MRPRTVACDEATRRGRLAKAKQFASAASMVFELAEDDDDLSSAVVTLCVHAGIAAADVICCGVLGEHAQGDNHAEAVALLDTVDKELGKSLKRLLSLKTRAGYSAQAIAKPDLTAAQRAMDRLIEAAKRR